jgi:hypothetical protein
MRNFRSQPTHPWPSRSAEFRNFGLSPAGRDVKSSESFACGTAGRADGAVIGAVFSNAKRRSP